jgi:hypothetical protein
LPPHDTESFLEVLDLLLRLRRKWQELEPGLHQEGLYPTILRLRWQYRLGTSVHSVTAVELSEHVIEREAPESEQFLGVIDTHL